MSNEIKQTKIKLEQTECEHDKTKEELNQAKFKLKKMEYDYYQIKEELEKTKIKLERTEYELEKIQGKRSPPLELYSDSNKSKNIINDFFALKNRIQKLIEENENPHKRAYQLLYDNMDILDQEITIENYNFLQKIITSIIQSSNKKENLEQKIIEWPTNQRKKLNIIESLISYSKELEILENIEHSPEWTKICELNEPEFLLTEFIKNKTISIKTIKCYKSNLRAQLLIDLISNGYCNTNDIIMFFNQFINRYEHIGDRWINIAEQLSKTHPIDFLISIPIFNPFDVLSLLVNPLSRKQGCIFDGKQCPQKLIDDFYDVYTEISIEPTKQSFEYINDEIESISKEYSTKSSLMKNSKEIYEQIQIVLNILKSIWKDNEIKYLDFSDITEIDFDHFDEYIDKNPCIGFYISRFPQVKNNIIKISELCSKEEENKNYRIPLGLFEFRIFSGIRCIEFQIPNEFPHDFSNELQEFLYNEISTRLCKSKIPIFSNFISFMMASTPNFITVTCHSEYLRNIVINLISSPKEKLLKIEIMKFLKRFLPSIIDILGSTKWNSYIDEELRYDSKDEIIRFLTNPWRYVLEDINESIKEDYNMKEFNVQKAVKNIINMILDLSSDRSIEKLKEYIIKDENELQDMIYHELINSKTKSEIESEIERELNKEWTDYSKYIKTYFATKIQTLPTSYSDSIYQPEPSFENFYNFFSQKLNFLPCKSQEVIVLIPKGTSNQEYILNYTFQNKILSVKFISQDGKPMLFLPPSNQQIQSLNLFCNEIEIKIFIIHSDFDVVKFKYTSMKSIEETYQRFDNKFREIQRKDFEGNGHIQILKKLDKIKVLFGENELDDFINILKDLNIKYHNEKIDNLFNKVDILDKIREDVLELEKYTNISFTIDHIEKPHQTTNFLSENLTNIIQSTKMNLIDTNFELFSDEYNIKYKFFFDSGSEFQRLMKLSTKLQLRPKNIRSYNLETSDEEMNRIEASEQLLTPSIFKNERELKVTINKIEIESDPLIFGVDVSPLQIRFENFTEEDILCEFNQINDDLPLPRYKNDIGFLIIEIPVESICDSSLKYVKNDECNQGEKRKLDSSPQSTRKKLSEKDQNNNEFNDIEETFLFEGVIKFLTSDESISPVSIEYHIVLHYISLTTFISIKNNHFFAFDDEKIEVVPFLAGPYTRLQFEKFTDKVIKRSNMLDKIIEMNDSKARKPEFVSRPNPEDERIVDITTVIAKEDNKENSYLSMNYEFGLTKEKSIQVSLHINTLPKLNKIDQLSLAIYSDSTKNFVDKDALINVGNLKRRVYFIVEILNTSNEPISPKDVELTAYNYFIQAEYDNKKNMNVIPPNQYGYAIYYFEARYSGPFPFPGKEKSDGCITVTINGISQMLTFKYRINSVDSQGEKFKFSSSINEFLYYDQKKESFEQCDIRNIYKDPIFNNSEKQILISPFCYSLYDKSNVLTRIDYDHKKGTLSRLYYDRKNPFLFEVFGFFPDSKRFMVVTIDKPEKISIRDKNIYIFARIKDEPNTFFPLFCPTKNNNDQFDSRKCTDDNIFRTFTRFFMNMMSPQDQRVRNAFTKYSTPDFLFDQTPLPSVFNFSFIIDLLGKGRNQISFIDVVPEIAKFTNNIEFSKHFEESISKYKSGSISQYSQFYSFISAMNELVNKRYEQLQTTNYYLKLPIPLDTIILKQNELFRKLIFNEDQINNIKYIKEFNNKNKNINDIEKNEIKKYKDKGFQITQILKWTEIDGLSSSTIEELKSHKEKKIKIKNKIETIKDENSEILTTDIRFIEFPEKVTIKSLYDKFEEILESTYNFASNIYSLKKSHQPLNRARTLLNQLIAVFLWQYESSICFPFESFTSYFNTAFSSMMQKLYNSKLSIMNFPIHLRDKMNKHNFVQIPTLIVSSINKSKFIQPIIHNFGPIKMNKHRNEELATQVEDNEINDKSKQKLDKNIDDHSKAVGASKQEKDEQSKSEKTASQSVKRGEIVSKDEFNSYSDDEEITVVNVSNNDNNDNIRSNLSGSHTRRSRRRGKKRITKK